MTVRHSKKGIKSHARMLLNMAKVRPKIWLLGEETFLNFDAYI